MPELVDPRNNATLIRAYPNAPEGSADAKMLLFANTFSTERRNGTVHISSDDGHAWARRRTFHPGEMQYCALTALDTPGQLRLVICPSQRGRNPSATGIDNWHVKPGRPSSGKM